MWYIVTRLLFIGRLIMRTHDKMLQKLLHVGMRAVQWRMCIWLEEEGHMAPHVLTQNGTQGLTVGHCAFY